MKKKFYIVFLFFLATSLNPLYSIYIDAKEKKHAKKVIIHKKMPQALPHKTQERSFLKRNEFSGDWFGARNYLGKKGIYFDSVFLLDINWPTFGGYKLPGHPLFQYFYEAAIEINTEDLIGLKGGTFYINFQYHGGLTLLKIMSEIL